ncbi:MAG: DNA alkylation repair protein [Bacteroidales bacterium]|nr:DNA alkylation repair protein [Bacteroidales bacterium]
MTTTALHEQLRDIKARLRTVMNGPVSQSMREKGLTYKLNFGVELPRLREMADELPHTYELAAALWKEDIRECRILAGMLMPAEAFDEDLADLWVEQMRFNEEAECTVLNLFSRLPFASTKAFVWIAREERLFRLCGWLLIARLFMQGARPSPRDADELLDQAQTELTGGDMSLARAAHKALIRFMDLGEEEEQQGEKVLAACGL